MCSDAVLPLLYLLSPLFESIGTLELLCSQLLNVHLIGTLNEDDRLNYPESELVVGGKTHIGKPEGP